MDVRSKPFFQEFCFQICVCEHAFTFWNHRFSRKALYLRYTKDISKCTHVCQLLMIVLLWRETCQKCCIDLWKCIYQVFCWGKHDLFVISESSITYMVLYSIYLSVLFFFLSLLKLWNVYTQHGALIGLRNEGTHYQKGNHLPHHFIQQHQVSVFHSTLYCSALWICCCNYAEEIYKDLAFIIWLFNVSFLFPHFRSCVVEPSITQYCRAKFL